MISGGVVNHGVDTTGVSNFPIDNAQLMNNHTHTQLGNINLKRQSSKGLGEGVLDQNRNTLGISQKGQDNELSPLPKAGDGAPIGVNSA